MERSRSNGRDRIVGLVALGGLFLGLWLAVSTGLREEEESATPEPPVATTQPSTSKPPPKPKSRAAPFVRLGAAGALDPEGDGRERDEEAELAVDGRQDTAWRTERYSSFFKEGVGLVLDAGRRVRVERVVVDAPAAGGRAAIRLADERDGPFVTVSPPRALTGGRTTSPVARRPGRYVVVWIVEVPDGGAVEVAEVRARARG